MDEQPAWLKTMEHGAIGEARAKAFLLDRFWVLERSVDIEGADYLIQQRLTGANFLERDPPRLGIVQVKFLQDEKTNIYIKSEYVIAKSGAAHDEFFVLVLSGHEDNERRFLLSAKEIAASCSLGSGKKEGSYLLTGKRLLTNCEFEAVSKKRALDRIEHALKNADFFKNRTFIGASHYVNVTPDQIDHDFLLPLDNGYVNLRKEFFRQKKKLQSTSHALEELTEAIGKILRSTDPEVAFEIFEQELKPHLDSRGFGSTLGVSCSAFDDEDFLAAVKNHKQRLSKLKELAVVDRYFDLLAAIKNKVVAEVAILKAMGKSDVVKVTVEYVPGGLTQHLIKVSRSLIEAKEFPVVEASEPGRHVIYFRPWDCLSYEIRADQSPAPTETDEISDAITPQSWIFRRKFQREIDLHLLGEDLVSPFA